LFGSLTLTQITKADVAGQATPRRTRAIDAIKGLILKIAHHILPERLKKSSPATICAEDIKPLSTVQVGVWAAVIVLIAVSTGLILTRNRNRTEPQFSGPIIEIPSAIAFREVGDLAPGSTDEALAGRLRDPKVLNNLAVRLFTTGDMQRGSALLSRALDLAPDDPVINYNNAHLQFEEGHVDAAVASAEKALASQPKFDEARLLIASADVKNKDIAGAKSQMMQLGNSNNPLALMLQGVIALSNNDVEGAINAFLQAAASEASLKSAASYNLGVAYQQKKNPKMAAQYYQSALNTNPGLVQATHNLALIASPPASARSGLSASTGASISVPSPPSIIVQQFQPQVARTTSNARITNTQPAVFQAGQAVGAVVQQVPVSRSLNLPKIGLPVPNTESQRRTVASAATPFHRITPIPQITVPPLTFHSIHPVQSPLFIEQQAQRENQIRLTQEHIQAQQELARQQAAQEQARKALLNQQRMNEINMAQAELVRLTSAVQSLQFAANSEQLWAAQHAMIAQYSGRRIIYVPNPAAMTANANALAKRSSASALQPRITALELQIQQLRSSMLY
jgi:tetratricopeptide (TPR) repeat protein